VRSRNISATDRTKRDLIEAGFRQKHCGNSTWPEATTQWSDPGPFANMEIHLSAQWAGETIARADHHMMRVASAAAWVAKMAKALACHAGHDAQPMQAHMDAIDINGTFSLLRWSRSRQCGPIRSFRSEYPGRRSAP
jgi:hypothetical protein